MPRIRWSIGSVLLVATALTACGGSGGGQQTVSSSAPPPAPTSGGTDGGSGGTGGAASSLNTARFRTVTVSVTPPGGGTVSDDLEAYGSAIQQCSACSERYQLGTSVALTARAGPGFVFERWQGSPCDGTTSPTCTVMIEADARITAVFRP